MQEELLDIKRKVLDRSHAHVPTFHWRCAQAQILFFLLFLGQVLQVIIVLLTQREPIIILGLLRLGRLARSVFVVAADDLFGAAAHEELEGRVTLQRLYILVRRDGHRLFIFQLPNALNFTRRQ